MSSLQISPTGIVGNLLDGILSFADDELRFAGEVGGIRNVDKITAFAFSPSGRFLATSSSSPFYVYNLPSLTRAITPFDLPPFDELVWSPDERTFAAIERSVFSRGICLFPSEGEKASVVRIGCRKPYSSLSFNAEGNLLAAVLGPGGEVAQVFDVSAGTVDSFSKERRRIQRAPFTGTGDFLLILWERAVELWDVRSGRGVSSYFFEDPWFYLMERSPNGEFVALAPSTYGDVVVLSLPSLTEVFRFPPMGRGRPTYIAWTPDSRSLVVKAADWPLRKVSL